MKTKGYITLGLLSLPFLLWGYVVFAATTQEFVPGQIPQTLLTNPRNTNQCQHYDASVGTLLWWASRLAFYSGQSTYFVSTLKANATWNTLTIINSTNSQNGTFYANGAPDSSKVYVYNEYWAISSTLSLIPDSFVPPFSLVSNVKPAWVDRVYVWYQQQPTRMIGIPNRRDEVVGQIVHNIRRRSPYRVGNSNDPEYNLAYLEYSWAVPWGIPHAITLNLLFTDTSPTWNRTDNNEYLCESIYVASCWDGITDNYLTGETTLTDWYKWILIDWNIVPWAKLTWSVLPLEECDDGALNGTPESSCSVECKLTGWCGDGTIQNEFEECDYGELNGSDLCTLNCTIPPIDAPVDEAVNE